MEIKREDILHLANLSNFSLSETEAESLEKDLDGIIKYISQLDELDTENVEPTYQDASREDLLGLSKEVIDHQIKVPKVL